MNPKRAFLPVVMSLLPERLEGRPRGRRRPGLPRQRPPPRRRGGTPPPPRREQAPPRRARDLKKSGGVLRQGGDVTFAFIEAHQQTWPVRVMCDALEVSP